jgi:hypothetical protein
MGTFVGHDHANDYIFKHYNIALAYGRFSGNKNTSYSVLVGGVRKRHAIDFPNGVRIIELTEGQRGFETWIRLNNGAVINKVQFPQDFAKENKKYERVRGRRGDGDDRDSKAIRNHGLHGLEKDKRILRKKTSENKRKFIFCHKRTQRKHKRKRNNKTLTTDKRNGINNKKALPQK